MNVFLFVIYTVPARESERSLHINNFFFSCIRLLNFQLYGKHIYSTSKYNMRVWIVTTTYSEFTTRHSEITVLGQFFAVTERYIA
jgi:hypothetical protein